MFRNKILTISLVALTAFGSMPAFGDGSNQSYAGAAKDYAAIALYTVATTAVICGGCYVYGKLTDDTAARIARLTERVQAQEARITDLLKQSHDAIMGGMETQNNLVHERVNQVHEHLTQLEARMHQIGKETNYVYNVTKQTSKVPEDNSYDTLHRGDIAASKQQRNLSSEHVLRKANRELALLKEQLTTLQSRQQTEQAQAAASQRSSLFSYLNPLSYLGW